VIIITGGIGTGKSLQGQLFAAETGYKWISTGQLFRSSLSEERQKELLSGKLLDDREVIELVDKTLDLINNDQIILDGFPRTDAQAQWLLNQVKAKRIDLTAIYNLVANREVVTKRLLARGRGDDNEEIIKERFYEYETKTLPLIDFFKKNNINVIDINADHTPEKVHEDIMTVFKK
jgi:adenylate kinase